MLNIRNFLNGNINLNILEVNHLIRSEFPFFGILYFYNQIKFKLMSFLIILYN